MKLYTTLEIHEMVDPNKINEINQYWYKFIELKSGLKEIIDLLQDSRVTTLTTEQCDDFIMEALEKLNSLYCGN